MMNNVFVITGATSGIGNALVKAFCEFGKVFAGYRNEEKVEELKDISPNVVPFYIDMTNSESIAKATEFITFQCDKVDMLMNVAGCVVGGAVDGIEMDRIREQFEVNTFSHLDFSKKLLKRVKINRIVNISSMASFGIFPFVAPYCASKRALDILFNSLALESGVKVISVKPGVIATPLWEKSIACNMCEEGKGHDKEFKFLIDNAKKNGEKGLSRDKVVEQIVKIYKAKKPKSSYTVGFDAKIAEIFSKLPQDFTNRIVKAGMKFRIK